MRSALVMVGLVVLLTSAATADFVIVQDGRAQCQVVLGQGAQAVEVQAADDLARALSTMTGVEVPLVREGDEQAGVPRILVGPCSLPEEIMAAVNERDYGGYIIRQVGNDLILRGPSEYGSSNAVYGLLEDFLGCHWYMPSELFEHIPQRAEVVLPVLDVAVDPGFRFRYFSGVSEGGPWQFRNRLDRPGNWNAPFLASMTHWIYRIYPPSKYGEEHPEFYPFIGGERRVNRDDSDQYAQPCTSNPAVVQVAIDTINRYFDENPNAHTYSVSINDNNTWCECDDCTALDADLPMFRGRKIFSDRYYTYVNAVARGVAQRHPDKFIGCFAYWGVEPVPVNIDRLEPNVYIGITQDCAQYFDRAYRQQDREFIKQWQNHVTHLGKYDYFGLGAIIPRYYPTLIAEDIKYSKAVGLEGYHSEAFPMWSHFGPQIYLGARLLFNPDLNHDVLLDEFFTDLFGPAAPEMAGFFNTLEEAWMNYERPGRWFEGISSMSQQISMYTPRHLRTLRAHLRRARDLADSDLVRQRVAYFERGFAYPANLIEGWLAAQQLMEMEISVENSAEVMRHIRQINRNLSAAPRLWQRSIMEDPISSNWYKEGARQGVIAQWTGFCQEATVRGVTSLAAAYEAAGDSREAEVALAELLEQLSGTDIETILRAHRGEFDDAPNLLANGSFEDTEATGAEPTGPEWTSEGAPPGWSTWKLDPAKGRLYLDASRARSGRLSAALQGGDTMCYIATVPVETGRRYAAMVYAWAEQVSPQRKTTLEVRWQDAEGRWFTGATNTVIPVPQAGSWQRLVSAVTAPEGAARAVILLAVYELGENERAWFDDAAFFAVE